MGEFLDSAHKVLKETGSPLSALELTELALGKGYLQTNGKTPSQTMKSKLSTDILNKKDLSLFMRAAEGKFALRDWKGQAQQEFVAPRFEKSLLDEDVIVLPSESIWKYIAKPGISAIVLENTTDFLNECKTMRRRVAEECFDVIQLVSVYLLHCGDKYLTYKRTKRLPESRLHDTYSLAFGGHLNPDDVLTLFDIFKPEFAGEVLQRELSEEVRLPRTEAPTIEYRGLLYDDSRDVSRQHLGIIYDVVLRSERYEIGERGFLMNPKFETLDEIEARISDFENWSALLVEHERKRNGQSNHL